MKKKLNKRILSALLAFVTFLSCCPVVSLASDDFVITHEGKSVAQISVDKHEKLEVSAEGIPEGTYQWQIKVPGADLWVNIHGQTDRELSLSNALLGSLLDSSNSAYVRCAAVSGSKEVAYTTELCATITEKTKEEPREPDAVINEAPIEPATEVPTEAATEVPTEAATEAPTEAATEAPTEAVTEAPTEAVTEAPTEAATEAATESQRVMMFAIARNTDATEAMAETEAPTEAKVITVTIRYCAVDRNNKFEFTQEEANQENAVRAQNAADPYVAHILSGSDLVDTTIPCRVIPGYTLDVPAYNGSGITKDGNNLKLNLTNITEDTTFIVYYRESMVPYNARYFMQNVYNDLYTERTDVLSEADKQNLRGYPDDKPSEDLIYPEYPPNDKVKGFSALFFQPDKIAADGSTVFEVYYDRNYYLINFDLNGGFGTVPVYARYGTAFTVANPTRPGYRFDGWELLSYDVKSDGTDEENAQFNTGVQTYLTTADKDAYGRVTSVPYFNVTYQAKWTEQQTTYKVAYWILDDEGNKTYIGSDPRTASSGDVIDGKDDLDDANICGNVEHTHTPENGCYSGYVKADNNGGNDDFFNWLGNQNGTREEPRSGYAYKLVKSDGTTYRWVVYRTNENGSAGPAQYYTIEESDLGAQVESYVGTGGTLTKHKIQLPCGLEAHTHTTACNQGTTYLDYVEEETFTDGDGNDFTIKTDKNVTVKGNGSTVVNVYYKYKEYTLKFYYAFSKTTDSTTTYHVVGGSSYHFGWTDDDDSLVALKNYTQGESVGQTGQVDELPKLNAIGIARYGQSTPQGALVEEVPYGNEGKTYKALYDSYVDSGTTYKLYYVSFTARYNDNISNLWPSGVFESVTRTESNTHTGNWTSKEAFVSAWNGEHHVLYTQNHSGAQTIKGTYQTLDENLLWKYADWYEDGTPVTCDKNGEVDFLCFWDNGANINWSIPSLFRYYTYVEALPGETYTTTYNGKNYYQLGNYLDTIDNYETSLEYSVNKQTATDIVGYTYAGRLSDQNVTLPDDQADLYEYKFNIYFYYDRNVNTLNFWNVNDYMVDGTGEPFAYGASLKKFVPADSHEFMTGQSQYSTTSYYPSTLEPNAYRFVGWYTTSGCLDGTRVDWTTMTMPDADVTVYAKWVPVTYDVKFYMDYERYEAGNSYHEITDTAHGDKMIIGSFDLNPDYVDAAGNADSRYRFVGWFYIDEDGTKNAFNPAEMAVRKDLHLFAEWTSSYVQEYTVSYQRGVLNKETGKYEPYSPAHTLAADSEGYALLATTKTFTAKSKDELTSFPDGTAGQLWLPHTNSHSIVMRDNNDDNVFTFYYVTADEAPYTVRYLDAATGEPILLDDDGKEIVGGDPHNKYAVVTEPFLYIEDYIPDAFHKQLVLSANEDENVIIFYYTKDEDIDDDDVGGGSDGGGDDDAEHARYLVNHWTENIDGSYYLQDEDDLLGTVDKTVSVTPNTYQGFSFNADKTNLSDAATVTGSDTDGYTVSGVVRSGKDEEGNKALVLDLYYSRGTFDYKVKYMDMDSNTKIADEKEVSGSLFEAVVTETALDIEGYDLFGNKTQTLKIGWDEGTNVITFKYTKKKVTIHYVPKCTDPNATGFGGVTQPLEYDVKDPSGSQAVPATGFYFVGWYTDEACEGDPITTSAIYDPALQTGVYEYTYYALFKPYELTISQTGMENTTDSAVYEVVNASNDVVARVMLTGNSSVTIQQILPGNYTVREITGNWTWTYSDNPTVEEGTNTSTSSISVEVGEDKKTVEFTQIFAGTCWLHSETRK